MANNIKASKSATIRRSRLPIVFLGFLVNAGYIFPTRAQTTYLQPADPHSIIVLQDENGFIATAFLTDRYYANGLRMGYTSYVSMISAVGEMALEKALIWDGVRFSYTQLFQTLEVHGQRSSMHKFGSRTDGLWF